MGFISEAPMGARPPFPPYAVHHPDGLDVSRLQSRPPSDRLKIAMLVPLSGPAGLWGPSCQTSARLGCQEINAAGGILGREVELIFSDAGGDPDTIADDTIDLLAESGAEAVIGMHISAVRQALVRRLRGRVPYVYTPVYEGGERSYGVFMIGETPPQQLKPSIKWLTEHRGARRWFLIGNDYVWPRQTHRAAQRYIKATGGQIVGVSYVPFGCVDHEPYLEQIRRERPDAVLVSMVGTDCVMFNRAFADKGLTSILRLSTASEENTLLGIGARNSDNLYFTTGYLSELSTPDNFAFLDRYQASFGNEAPVLNTIGQSCYEGLRLYAELSRRARSLRVDALWQAAEGLNYVSARGRVTMRSRHLYSDMYLAEADSLRFSVVAHFPLSE
jgi:ABC-type branched-subunit amino acid transport system substrate-binding protein